MSQKKMQTRKQSSSQPEKNTGCWQIVGVELHRARAAQCCFIAQGWGWVMTAAKHIYIGNLLRQEIVQTCCWWGGAFDAVNNQMELLLKMS
jgi:hypothetical protein